MEPCNCSYGKVCAIQLLTHLYFIKNIRHDLPATFIKGVINLRGEVIPIFDLRDRFGLDHTDYTSLTRIIVVETGGKLVGIVVDEVSQVILIPEAQIEPPPNVIGGLSKEYIVGVGKIGERLIVLLKIDKILSQENGEKGEEEVTEITVKREETA